MLASILWFLIVLPALKTSPLKPPGTWALGRKLAGLWQAQALASIGAKASLNSLRIEGFGNSGSGGNLGNSGMGSSGNVTSRSCRASTRIVWLFISDKLLITKGFGNSGSGGNLGNSGMGSSGNVTSRSCRASPRIVWLFISDKLLITKGGKNSRTNNGKL
ncbi:hypothetical protein NC653_037651 [Populus alba x Populus x berolinensis]|uniref:Glycine-rich protein n=1 Tax=Populus alba x Populus x berolinensis TaxID=444605 RepID=A0AAD6LFD6_9ROSI|nr:hypothetical protein NC653_037651 [Populus alba x Populus x berolinensis]